MKNLFLSLAMVVLLICGVAFVVTAADEKAPQEQPAEQAPAPAEQPPAPPTEQPPAPPAAPAAAGEAAEGKMDLNALGYEGGVPESITLKSDLWKEHTKGAVQLTHTKHTLDHGVACDQCHHVYQDGKNVWKPGDKVQKCQECHTNPEIKGEKKLPEAEQKLNLKLAFHNNCQGCHKDHKKENPNSKAPVTCTECHGGKE